MPPSPHNPYVETRCPMWWYWEAGPLGGNKVMRMALSQMGSVPYKCLDFGCLPLQLWEIIYVVHKALSLWYFCSSLLFSSVTQSYLTLCDPMDCSTPGPSVLHYLHSFIRFLSIELVMPSNHLIFCGPLILLPSIFPSIRTFSNELALQISSQSVGVSALASVLPMNSQDWLVWSCCLRDSQESSPAPQFESINSLTLSLLYGSTLTSIHDYWKIHSFDYMDLCCQSDVSAF